MVKAATAAVNIANPLACLDICPRMELMDAAVFDRIPTLPASAMPRSMLFRVPGLTPRIPLKGP